MRLAAGVGSAERVPSGAVPGARDATVLAQSGGSPRCPSSTSYAPRWGSAHSLLALLVAFTGGAQASATLIPLDSNGPLSGTTALPECLPADLIGTQSGSERTVGTIVVTDTIIHMQATTTLDYRVDFPDGSYVIGTSTEHFTLASKGDTPLVSTTTGVEPRTLYDASGNPIGTAAALPRPHHVVRRLSLIHI